MKELEWRVHLTSPPARVFHRLSTPDGRESFWAESADETDGVIEFVFPNGQEYRGEIVESDPVERYAIRYFGGLAEFVLVPDGTGGTDLTLRHAGIPADEHGDTAAGWVSVLLSLKAAVDHSVDLRNHDPERTWDAGYVDN